MPIGGFFNIFCLFPLAYFPDETRPSIGFLALSGNCHFYPTLTAPGIFPDLQKAVTVRSVTSHISAISLHVFIGFHLLTFKLFNFIICCFRKKYN